MRPVRAASEELRLLCFVEAYVAVDVVELKREVDRLERARLVCVREDFYLPVLPIRR